MTPEEIKKIPKPRLTVVNIETQEVIHAMTLKSTEPRFVEKVMSGMLRNMNTDAYFVKEDF